MDSQDEVWRGSDRRPTRRMLLGISMSLLVIGVLAVRILYPGRPSFPAAWRPIRAGMGRAQIVSMIGPPTYDMRDLKGFDIYHFAPNEQRYWQLQLNYATSESEKIDTVVFRYVDRGNGLHNLAAINPDESFLARYSE